MATVDSERISITFWHIDTIDLFLREACSSWNDHQRSLKVIKLYGIGQTILLTFCGRLISNICSIFVNFVF